MPSSPVLSVQGSRIMSLLPSHAVPNPMAAQRLFLGSRVAIAKRYSHFPFPMLNAPKCPPCVCSSPPGKFQVSELSPHLPSSIRSLGQRVVIAPSKHSSPGPARHPSKTYVRRRKRLQENALKKKTGVRQCRWPCPPFSPGGSSGGRPSRRQKETERT